MKRTPDMEPSTDFSVDVPITKAYVDKATGQRHIVGVASGVAEDKDGERVSKNGVVGMVNDVLSGGVKLTSSHQQDWATEIGEVVKAEHDSNTDEMMIDTVLPPEGVDPIADKAWRVANTERVGFSVGGKLLKSYFERNELGKKRKVLDAIKLRHVALTKSPSYPHSFAEAVAKTWDGETPDDEAFTLEVEDVAKDMSTGSWASQGGGNSGQDSQTGGQRNAGSRKPSTKGMSTEDDGDTADPDDTDPDDKLPEGRNQDRHLACPNCGHEFAADLPLDPEERQVDDTGDDNEPDEKDDEKPDTGKTVAEESAMSALSDTLEALRGLAAAETVAKTDEPAEAVEKDGGESLDVLKMVAAGHKAHEDRFTQLEKSIGEGFELIAKSHQKVLERLAEMPQGRKSTARILPPATGHEADVEKSLEKRIEEAPDAVSALKIQNEAIYGIS